MGWIVVLVMVVPFTISAFVLKSATLSGFAGICWVLLGGFAYTQFTTPWIDWQYYIFIFSFLAGLPVMLIQTISLRVDKEEDKITEEDKEFDFSNDPLIDNNGDENENGNGHRRKQMSYGTRLALKRRKAKAEKEKKAIIRSGVMPPK